jgi:hypothetical protein
MARTTLISLLQELVAIGAPGMTFQDLLTALYARSAGKDGNLAKQSVGNMAKCIAGICAGVSMGERKLTVERFASDLKTGNEKRKHLSLLCIGKYLYLMDLLVVSLFLPVLPC